MSIKIEDRVAELEHKVQKLEKELREVKQTAHQAHYWSSSNQRVGGPTR